MKDATIKVGVEKPTKFQVAIPVSLPATWQEVTDMVAKLIATNPENAEFATDRFVRGLRIWLQEDSGARDFVESSNEATRTSPDFAEQVRKLMLDALSNPTEAKGRAGRPKAPTVVELPNSAWKSFSKAQRAEIEKSLAAANSTLRLIGE